MEEITQNNQTIDTLDELKYQYSVFSEKAVTASNEMVISLEDIKKNSVNSIRKTMSVKLKMMPTIFIIYAFFYFIDVVSLLFLIATYAMVIADAYGDYYLNKLNGNIGIDTNLITYRLELLRIKRLRTIKLMVLAPISVLWAAWFCITLLRMIGNAISGTPISSLIGGEISLTVTVSITVAVVCGLYIEIYLYRKMQQYIDLQLDAIKILKQ